MFMTSSVLKHCLCVVVFFTSSNEYIYIYFFFLCMQRSDLGFNQHALLPEGQTL
jgi:hypothetical protein